MNSEVLQLAKQLAPQSDEILLTSAVNLICEQIQNYCNIETVPPELYHTAAAMTVEACRRLNTMAQPETAEAKHVTRGDASYEFASQTEQLEKITSGSFVMDWQRQLNAYRRMRR